MFGAAIRQRQPTGMSGSSRFSICMVAPVVSNSLPEPGLYVKGLSVSTDWVAPAKLVNGQTDQVLFHEDRVTCQHVLWDIHIIRSNTSPQFTTARIAVGWAVS